MFAKRLKFLRERAGYSQEALAEILGGITPQQVSRWETGKNVPRQITITRLAEIFNVSTDYLLDRTDDPHYRITETDLAPDELLLVQAYRTARIWDLLRIITEISPEEGDKLGRILTPEQKPNTD